MPECQVAVGRGEEFFAAADPGKESPAMVAFCSPTVLADACVFALWPLARHGHAVAETAAWLRTAADTHTPNHVRARILCLTRSPPCSSPTAPRTRPSPSPTPPSTRPPPPSPAGTPMT